jgi:hypothetical protein
VGSESVDEGIDVSWEPVEEIDNFGCCTGAIALGVFKHKGSSKSVTVTSLDAARSVHLISPPLQARDEVGACGRICS